jgi:4-azaleucine resistance transporter AzlC
VRSFWRTAAGRLGPSLARDIALVCLADGIVGASFGAITVASGFPFWLPMLLSVVVFAGASQFMFVAIIAAGGSPLAALVAGLLVNARHLPFGLAIGDVIGRGALCRVIGSHLMIDESVAFAMAQRDPQRRRAAYWGCGAALFVCWNAGVLAGALGGEVISDTDTFGMDAAFPAVLLALIVPALRERTTRMAAIVGAAIAVALGPVLPAGLPVLLALTALPLAMIGRWRSDGTGSGDGNPAGASSETDPEADAGHGGGRSDGSIVATTDPRAGGTIP